MLKIYITFAPLFSQLYFCALNENNKWSLMCKENAQLINLNLHLLWGYTCALCREKSYENCCVNQWILLVEGAIPLPSLINGTSCWTSETKSLPVLASSGPHWHLVNQYPESLHLIVIKWNRIQLPPSLRERWISQRLCNALSYAEQLSTHIKKQHARSWHVQGLLSLLKVGGQPYSSTVLVSLINSIRKTTVRKH